MNEQAWEDYYEQERQANPDPEPHMDRYNPDDVEATQKIVEWIVSEKWKLIDSYLLSRLINLRMLTMQSMVNILLVTGLSYVSDNLRYRNKFFLYCYGELVVRHGPLEAYHIMSGLTNP